MKSPITLGITQDVQAEHNQKCADAAVEEFNQHYGIVLATGKTFAVSKMKNALDQIHPQMTRTSELATYYANQTVKVSEGTTRLLVDFWLKSPLRRTYKELVFEPVGGMTASAELPEGEKFNLYQGLTLMPAKGNYPLILKHIHEIWCESDSKKTKYVLSWLAMMFQYPEKQAGTALVLASGEGTGKNIILDMIAKMFGIHGVVLSSSDEIVGRFNNRLGTAIFVFCNEAVWGGDAKSQGKLKSLITDPVLNIEQKYIPIITVKNCTHLVFASNNDWVVPVGLDDRRFFVLDVSELRKGDTEYFKNLAYEISNGGAEGFAYYLLNLGVEKFDPARMPKGSSDLKLDNKMRSTDTVTRWWHGCLHDGEIGDLHYEGDWGTGEISVNYNYLYSAYESTLGGRAHKETKPAFTKKLKNLNPSWRIIQKRCGRNKRMRFVQIAQLQDCRDSFSERIVQIIDWPDSIEDSS
jgi:hypothetical protein